MSDTIETDATFPALSPDPESIVAGVSAAARALADHADDIGMAARRICVELKDLTTSATVRRILFHIAVAEGSSLRSRFVADHLSTHGHPRLARLLTDHAIASGAKPWQRRRLEPLLNELPHQDSGAGVRETFDLTVTAEGGVSLAGTGGSSPIEFGGGTETPWFQTLIRRLDDRPDGIHHDVVRIRTQSTVRAQDALDSVLERLAILPVVSAVVTESTDAALSISERLGRPLLERSRTLLLAPNRSGENVIVSVRGSELLDAGPTADLVLPEPKTSQPWPLRSGWKPSSAHRQ